MDLVASSTVKVGVGERWIKHYSSSHKILLVGEGDFSFSVCLANAFGSAVNMVATSLDAREMLLSKYSQASYNLRRLEELGCTLIHEVDVKTMDKHPFFFHKYFIFDRIVFNFPHAGFTYKEHNATQIALHQEVVKGFFQTATWMLKGNGEIHVTHKTALPFSAWRIEDLAKDVGMRLRDEVPFSTWDYPGYENKRGDGDNSDGTFRVGLCSTFKFNNNIVLV